MQNTSANSLEGKFKTFNGENIRKINGTNGRLDSSDVRARGAHGHAGVPNHAARVLWLNFQGVGLHGALSRICI